LDHASGPAHMFRALRVVCGILRVVLGVGNKGDTPL
jgi:hypothetical protein